MFQMQTFCHQIKDSLLICQQLFLLKNVVSQRQLLEYLKFKGVGGIFKFQK